MFSTKNVTTTPLGMWGALAASAGSIAPEKATSAPKPTNHGTAWRAPTNSRAPTGQVKAQSDTADELAKPPRLHCRANGSKRLIHSWLVRKRR